MCVRALFSHKTAGELFDMAQVWNFLTESIKNITLYHLPTAVLTRIPSVTLLHLCLLH